LLVFPKLAAGNSSTQDVKVTNSTTSPVTLGIAIADSGACFTSDSTSGPPAAAAPAAAAPGGGGAAAPGGAPAAPPAATPICYNGDSLAAGKLCAITVKFIEPSTPPMGGCSGQLIVTDSITKTPQTVQLTGQ